MWDVCSEIANRYKWFIVYAPNNLHAAFPVIKLFLLCQIDRYFNKDFFAVVFHFISMYLSRREDAEEF